jgi:hypothetical protein
MSTTLWLAWVAFMFLFVLSPLGYGWSYRGWGPPLPRYIQRRRAARSSLVNVATPARYEAWGRGGDFIWIVLLIGSGWALAGLMLRRG